MPCTVSTRFTAWKWLAPFWGMSLLCGCGKSLPLGRVDGTVTLDRKPIGNVFVMFVPLDRRQPQSTGLTDEAGHFVLRCNNGRPGAVVGDHRVVLVDASRFPSEKTPDDEPLPEGPNAPPSRIAPIYTRPDKTPLRQTVAAGSQTVAVEASSRPGPG